mgnify:CR=1 FL=1
MEVVPISGEVAAGMVALPYFWDPFHEWGLEGVLQALLVVNAVCLQWALLQGGPYLGDHPESDLSVFLAPLGVLTDQRWYSLVFLH